VKRQFLGGVIFLKNKPPHAGQSIRTSTHTHTHSLQFVSLATTFVKDMSGPPGPRVRHRFLSAEQIRNDVAAERDLDADFKAFSTAHSWYKHIAMPTELLIAPWWEKPKVFDAEGDEIAGPTDAQPVMQGWTAYYPGAVIHQIGGMQFTSETPLLAAIKLYPVEINGLVYGGKHGIHLTIEYGDVEWLTWLRSMGYSAAADAIETSEEGVQDDDDIIVALRAKEYERMRREFVHKVRAIQAAVRASMPSSFHPAATAATIPVVADDFRRQTRSRTKKQLQS